MFVRHEANISRARNNPGRAPVGSIVTDNADISPLRLLGDVDQTAVCVDGVCLVPGAEEDQPDEG